MKKNSDHNYRTLKPETHCIYGCPRRKIGIMKQSWRIMIVSRCQSFVWDSRKSLQCVSGFIDSSQVLIWHLVLISSIIWQTLFNWQHSSNFHWNCKMVDSSKVTETLWQEVVQMKAKGMILSAIYHSTSVISRIEEVVSERWRRKCHALGMFWGAGVGPPLH